MREPEVRGGDARALVQARKAEAVLDAISDAVITLDRDFCIAYINTEAARINKKPAAAFLGRRHWDEWPAAIGTEFERQFRRAMTERITVRFLEHYYVPGEYDQWIDVAAYPAAEEDGGGLHLVYREVTERVQREQRERFLADLAERARTLTDPDEVIADAVRSVGKFLDLSRCTFADIDANTDTCTVRLDYCADDSVASIAGVLPWSSFGPQVSRELEAGLPVVVNDVRGRDEPSLSEYAAAYDAVGVRAHVTVPAVYSARLVTVISAQSATPRQWTPEEVELLRLVVERTWLTVELARQHQTLHQEVATRKSAEASLAQSEARFRMMTDSMPQIAWTADAGGAVEHYNQGWYHYSGLSLAQKSDQDWQAVLHPDDMERVTGVWDRALRAGKVFEVEYRLRRRDGQYRWHLGRSLPVCEVDGQITAWIGTATDIQDRVELEVEREARLQRAQVRAEREAVLGRIGLAIRASLSPDEVQAVVVAALGSAFKADRVYFVSLDTARDQLVIQHDYCIEDVPPLRGVYAASALRVGMEAVFSGGSTLVAPDTGNTAAVPWGAKTTTLLASLRVRSFINVPFHNGHGDLVGVLGIAMADTPRQWTPDEVLFAEQVATETRAAVEAARVQQRERNIAQQLQDALLPALPESVPGLSLYGFYRAALDEAGIGGDFMDAAAVGPNLTYLCVADLSGKGLAAAQQVALVKHMMRFALHTSITLADAVTSVDRVLTRQNLLTGFATLFAGIYDASTRTLTYVNAGQEPGLIRRATTGRVELLSPTGPVLGGLESTAGYEEKSLSLLPGDVLALFTDGLTEVGPSRKELLGLGGVSDLLRDCRTGSLPAHSPQSTVERLIADVDSFARGGARDDIALLIGIVGSDAGVSGKGSK